MQSFHIFKGLHSFDKFSMVDITDLHRSLFEFVIIVLTVNLVS
jgi:hypothetical protein